ncbi:MAG: MFS transporter, partial [Candidatus Stahlbacteria bacterium]
MPIIRKFADIILIRENEYKHVFYFFLVYLIAGCGNAFGRSSTDALFFKRFGIEYLPIMYIVLGVSLSLISIFYAAFADRIKPERFFITLYILMIGALIITWSVMSYGTTNYIYPVYFVVYEVASEVFLIHAAFYLSQNFDSMQAKRVFPVIMSGALIGSIIGGTVVSLISTKIGVQNIIILWCVLLGTSISLIAYWHKHNGISPYYRPQYKSSKQFKQAVSQITFGAKLLKSSNLLKFSSIALFFMVITFYVLCYSVNRVYTTTFTTEEELTSFFGKLTAVTSFLALTMQIFITNKAINRFGAKNINLLFPLTSLVSYIGLLTSFSLHSALAGSINKDAIMPAFRNPVRAIFFNAIPENIRGRALSIQIVIVIPLALAVCGTLLLFMQKMGEPIYFLAIGVSAAICYLFFNHKMNNAYLSEILSNLKQRIFIPDSETANSSTYRDINTDDFVKKIDKLDNNSLISFIKILVKSNPDTATDVILNNTLHASPAIKDQI